jgi:hypothetical protein
MRERLVKYFLDVIILFDLWKSKRLSGYYVLGFLHTKFLIKQVPVPFKLLQREIIRFCGFLKHMRCFFVNISV